jgi:SAM-dependent methyltransferase
MSVTYVHGYDRHEAVRLQDQASTLEDLLHGDTHYPEGSFVLEAGCGVGAQTVPLAQRSPGARFTAVDISAASLAAAERKAHTAGLSNVRFLQGEIEALPFEPGSFDHLFVCFVLEHLPAPVQALAALRRLVRPGGTVTVIEGDHGSTYFHPDSAGGPGCGRLPGRAAAQGRGQRPDRPAALSLLNEAGCTDIRVTPRMVYVDGSRPNLADGFTRRTFTAMIAGVREPAIAAGLSDPEGFDAGITALGRAAEPDGVFATRSSRLSRASRDQPSRADASLSLSSCR